jgi:hypothetical protein
MYCAKIGKNREYKNSIQNNSATSNSEGGLAVWLRGVVDIEEFFEPSSMFLVMILCLGLHLSTMLRHQPSQFMQKSAYASLSIPWTMVAFRPAISQHGSQRNLVQRQRPLPQPPPNGNNPPVRLHTKLSNMTIPASPLRRNRPLTDCFVLCPSLDAPDTHDFNYKTSACHKPFPIPFWQQPHEDGSFYCLLLHQHRIRLSHIIRPAGRRRDLRSGVRRVRNTGHIGKRHRPHHWRRTLRPLFIHPRLPERL